MCDTAVRAGNDILSRAVNQVAGIINEADKGVKEVFVIREEFGVEVIKEGIHVEEAVKAAKEEYRGAKEELAQLAEFLDLGFKEVARVYGGKAWSVAPGWEKLEAGEFSWQGARAHPLAPTHTF